MRGEAMGAGGLCASAGLSLEFSRCLARMERDLSGQKRQPTWQGPAELYKPAEQRKKGGRLRRAHLRGAPIEQAAANPSNRDSPGGWRMHARLPAKQNVPLPLGCVDPDARGEVRVRITREVQGLSSAGTLAQSITTPFW